MTLLILGGTIFLGRALVEAARARGHQVTLFNRGRHNPDLFPDVEKVRGDRNVDLAALRDRRFDAVLDPSAYIPGHATTIADALGGSIGHYVFISSISVYRRFPPRAPFDESAERAEGDSGYGPQKARTEDAFLASLGRRVACVRPGLIVGPHDPTERFTYWLRRVAEGGHVLAPGRPDRPVQFIDVRDLAEWCVVLAEGAIDGCFNAVTPSGAITMGEVIEACLDAANRQAHVRWVPDRRLLDEKVSPWTEMPLWIPEDDPEMGGLLLARSERAVAAGLTFRPLADTAHATLAWAQANAVPPDSPIRVVSLSREREAAILSGLD